MGDKTCTKCSRSKPVSEFHRDKHREDGCTSACKECRNGVYRTNYTKEYGKKKWDNWYANNTEKYKNYKKDRYYNIPGERQRKSKAAKKWKLDNPVRHESYRNSPRHKELEKQWKSNFFTRHPGIRSLYAARYRAAKEERILGSEMSEFDEFVLSEAYHLAEIRSEQFGFDWHVDHMIPLRGKKVSGLHCASNIQVIPASLNMSKGNKMIMTKPLEWLNYL